MKQIGLREQLVENLEQVASEQGTTTEEVLDKLVSQFLYDVALKKMEAETLAFQQMYPQLTTEHFGEYVAIHNSELIDFDTDLAELRRRIRQKFGRMPILLRQVNSDKEIPTIMWRGGRSTEILAYV